MKKKHYFVAAHTGEAREKKSNGIPVRTFYENKLIDRVIATKACNTYLCVMNKIHRTNTIVLGIWCTWAWHKIC